MEEKMMSLFCVGCNEIFVIPSRRGRPPKFCAQCSGAPQVNPTGRLTRSQPALQNLHTRSHVETRALLDSFVVSADRELVGNKSFPLLHGVRMMSHFCYACNEVFAIQARRGRPPKYCKKCIENGDATTHEEQRVESNIAKANARIDNLEMLLKSRGTHISQNRHRWE